MAKKKNRQKQDYAAVAASFGITQEDLDRTEEEIHFPGEAKPNPWKVLNKAIAAKQAANKSAAETEVTNNTDIPSDSEIAAKQSNLTTTPPKGQTGETLHKPPAKFTMLAKPPAKAKETDLASALNEPSLENRPVPASQGEGTAGPEWFDDWKGKPRTISDEGMAKPSSSSGLASSVDMSLDADLVDERPSGVTKPSSSSSNSSGGLINAAGKFSQQSLNAITSPAQSGGAELQQSVNLAASGAKLAASAIGGGVSKPSGGSGGGGGPLSSMLGGGGSMAALLGSGVGGNQGAGNEDLATAIAHLTEAIKKLTEKISKQEQGEGSEVGPEKYLEDMKRERSMVNQATAFGQSGLRAATSPATNGSQELQQIVNLAIQGAKLAAMALG